MTPAEMELDSAPVGSPPPVMEGPQDRTGEEVINMGMTRQAKEEAVSALVDKLERSKGAVVANYKGLDVESVNAISRQVSRGRGRISRGQEHADEACARGHPHRETR